MKESKVTLPPSTHAPAPSTASNVAGSHASRILTVGAADAGAATTAHAIATARPAPTELRIDMPVSLRSSHLPRRFGRPVLRAEATAGSMLCAVLALTAQTAGGRGQAMQRRYGALISGQLGSTSGAFASVQTIRPWIDGLSGEFAAT